MTKRGKKENKREIETPNGRNVAVISVGAIKPVYIAVVPPDRTFKNREMAGK